MTVAELLNIVQQFKSEHGTEDTLLVLDSICEVIAHEAEPIEDDDDTDDGVVVQIFTLQ